MGPAPGGVSSHPAGESGISGMSFLSWTVDFVTESSLIHSVFYLFFPHFFSLLISTPPDVPDFILLLLYEGGLEEMLEPIKARSSEGSLNSAPMIL